MKGMVAKMSACGRHTYIVTSCKGGIGKSTVAANLAAVLAFEGHRTLLIDCDFSNRSLDLILGCEDSVVYDISDLVVGRAAPDRVILEDDRCDELFFIPAPLAGSEMFGADAFSSAVERAADSVNAEFVIIDTPGAADGVLPVIAPAADGALIVASHQPTSIRGAEKMGYILDRLGVDEQYLIINMFDAAAVLAGERSGINELIDKTHIKLLGIVPVSAVLAAEQERGRLAVDGKPDKRDHANRKVKKGCREAAAAFREIAARLSDERVPLLSGMSKKKRRKLLYT